MKRRPDVMLAEMFALYPAGAAIVSAIGPIRQLVRAEEKIPRRYLVIAPGTPDHHGAPVQVLRMIRTQASSALAQGNT
jgi:hypothetical protein